MIHKLLTKLETFERLENRLNRALQWLYAFVFGYFWLPCPRCGRGFGGHEEGGGRDFRGQCGARCCPRCPGDTGFYIDAAGTARVLGIKK